MTQQHFKDECDINHIMERYERTGSLTDPLKPGTREPIFGDFSTEFDFHQAQGVIAHAKQQFDALPSRIRDRFANDPGELLAFLQNPANRDEAISLGLIEKAIDVAPAPIIEDAEPIAPVKTKKAATLPPAEPAAE